MEVMVYYNSGNKARFDLDKVTLMTAKELSDNPHWLENAFKNGKSAIITDNVCFIRQIEQKEEED